jgi:hypothetical protein
MGTTITLPEGIESRLRRKAKVQDLSIQELALDILYDALDRDDALSHDELSLEEVVARIRALPSKPHNIRTAQHSLADALKNAPKVPDFDIDAWEHEWEAVEAEMKAITYANDVAEGRI